MPISTNWGALVSGDMSSLYNLHVVWIIIPSHIVIACNFVMGKREF